MSTPSPPTNSGLPPGPSASAWEQAKSWIENPTEFWTSCHQDYGDTFTVQFGSQGTTVVFCDPLDIKEIFALKEDRFIVSSYNEHYGVIMGHQSLLVSDGTEHREKRRYLSPSFQVSWIPSWIKTVREKLFEQLNELQVGDDIPIRRVIHEVSFDIILEVLFESETPEIRKLLRRIFVDHIIKNYGTWSPWARFKQWHPALRKLLGFEIAKIRSKTTQPQNEGMFYRIARYKDGHDEYLSDEQIEDQVFTMLIAGVDPSAIATTWAVRWIWEQPEIIDRLTREQESNDTTKWLTDSKNYLHACCQESLRMYPVVTTPSGRKLLQDSTIRGTRYEAGVTLIPATYLVHRSPDLYPNPDAFQPERFLDSNFQTYEYFPFGGGNRRCIGAQLALITMKAILGGLVERCELSLTASEPPTPVRHGTLLAPAENFHIRLEGLRGDPA